MTTPPLDDLSAFAEVARTRSFTRAAAALGMSTSNLSHTIRRLETRLGARLLQRSSRSVAATAAGDRLLAQLEPALARIGEALHALDRESGRVGGLLRLTATRQAYDAVIAPALPGFLAAHSDVTLEVLIDYAFRDIVADRFDAGVRLGEKLEADMIAVRLGPELQMAVVASPDYFARSAPLATPEDLMRHRCIQYRLVSADTVYAWEFERAGEKTTVRPPGPLIFNEPGLMREAALAGLGVAYLLLHEAEPHLRQGRLARRLADWTPPFPGFHLYYPSRRQMRPALAAFVKALRAA